jgi:hypothetical protein
MMKITGMAIYSVNKYKIGILMALSKIAGPIINKPSVAP